MRIIEAKTRKHIKDFVRLPSMLHKGNPCYVPPIWLDENNAYTKRNNPILANSDFVMHLIYDDNEHPIGRNLVYIDHSHNAFYNAKIGFFGALECIDDNNAFKLLMDAAQKWLTKRDMTIIRGPIHPVAENWGFVYDGFEYPPVYMSPWNPEYYNKHITELGYTKAKDLLVYEIDMQKGYSLPERYNKFYDKFMNHYPNIKIRPLNIKNIKKDALKIWELTNLSLKDNWGYVPVDLNVMEDMLKKLKLIVDPKAVWIVEDNHTVVGYCLGFPDINSILKNIKGNLLPFGWAKLIFGAKKLRDYRLFGLAVHPDYQGMALDALMYINLYNHLKDKKIRMEANYILEDNYRIKNALEKLGMEYMKTYRIYDKEL